MKKSELRQMIREEILKESGGHHYKYGKKWYGDTGFVQFSQGVLPNSELKHMGFGEFYLETPDGKVQFARGGKEFTGQVGRSHEIYDDANGKIVAKLIKAMEKKKKSELMTEGVLTEGDAYTDGKKYFTMAFDKFTPSTTMVVLESSVQDLLESGLIKKGYVKRLIAAMASSQKRLAKFIK